MIGPKANDLVQAASVCAFVLFLNRQSGAPGQNRKSVMKVARSLVLIAMAAFLISCGRSKYSLEACVAEWGEQNGRMWDAYCQTNIHVAEAGLLSYRSCLTNRIGDPRYQEIAEGFPGYLLQTESQLWGLYEFCGDTNGSERVYYRAREVSRLDDRWVREPISKTELSNFVYSCDLRCPMGVPWKGITNATHR